MDIEQRTTEFLGEAHVWLAANAPEFEDPTPRVSQFAALAPEEQKNEVERARAWEARKARDAWNGLAVPAEYGGQGRSVYESILFADEEGNYRLPLDVFAVTKGMIVPTLLTWGSEEQKHRYISATLDGDDLWCQLYSEPGAGSDLAALSTRAERTPHGWIVNGEKVWISHGQRSDYGYLLARTSPNVVKHEGLSAFVVDMRADGVTTRPLIQATGGSTFAEVFFDDVHLPEDALIGPEDQGWRVAITTLMNERLSLGAGSVPWNMVLQLAHDRGVTDDPGLRQELLGIYAQRKMLELLKEQMLAAVREGRDPGPEGSAMKILTARTVERSAQLSNRIIGPDALLNNAWTEFHIGVPGMKLGGGTEEILKNIIGERVLGLPMEPRTDRDVTWSELRASGSLG